MASKSTGPCDSRKTKRRLNIFRGLTLPRNHRSYTVPQLTGFYSSKIQIGTTPPTRNTSKLDKVRSPWCWDRTDKWLVVHCMGCINWLSVNLGQTEFVVCLHFTICVNNIAMYTHTYTHVCDRQNVYTTSVWRVCGCEIHLSTIYSCIYRYMQGSICYIYTCMYIPLKCGIRLTNTPCRVEC